MLKSPKIKEAKKPTRFGTSNEHITLDVDILNKTNIYFLVESLLISIDTSKYL